MSESYAAISDERPELMCKLVTPGIETRMKGETDES